MTQRVVNYTYGTGNPVLPNGSVDVRDGIDNLQSFDIFMNADEDKYNQRDGEIVRTVAGMNNEFDAQILNMGFTRVGTFASGATLTNPRQTLLWDVADGGDGQEYGWSGAFPKVVPATSTPTSTGGISVGAWISRFDPELRIQVRESLRRSYAMAGYNLVSGSFDGGGELVNSNDVLLQELSGKAFSGPVGVVAPGTIPSAPGFIEVSNVISVSLSDIKSLGNYFPNNQEAIAFHVAGYYNIFSGGGGTFVWGNDVPKSSHDGGMIIDPLAIQSWDGSVATLPAMLATRNSGFGCFVRQVPVDGVIQVVDFGAVTYDESAEVSNHAALKAAQRHALTYAHPTTGGGRIFGTKEIRFPAGEMYFKGHRPFNYTRTELEAMGAGRYHSGMKFSGAGRNATVLLFKNTGSETWLYDNRDPNFPNISDTGIFDNLTFEHLAIHNVAGRYVQGGGRTWSVPAASQMNGFWMQSFGWEKMFVFHSVNFYGFDRMYVFRGNGNVDQHTWTSCRFDEIIDCLFDVDNNQSVTNRLFGVDVLCRGSVIKVGPSGGGDFTWVGGSILQYFVTGEDGKANTTYANARPYAFLDVNLLSTASGPSLARVNGNFSFSGLRFENYNGNNLLVRAQRTNSVNYGEVKAAFYDCTFLVDQVVPNGQTSSSIRTTHRDLVDITKQTSSIIFDSCAFGKFQNFRITDVGNGTDISASATIEFRSSYFDINQPDSTYASGGGSIRSRTILVSNTAKKCNGQFVCERCKTNVSGNPGSYMIATDYADTYKNCAMSSGKEYIADIKSDNVAWPSTGTSGNRLYLPEGARVIGFMIDKTAGSVPGAGSATYAVKLSSAAGGTLYTTPTFQESSAFFKKEYFTSSFEIGNAPNNFVNLQGLNGSDAVNKGNGRAVVIYI